MTKKKPTKIAAKGWAQTFDGKVMEVTMMRSHALELRRWAKNTNSLYKEDRRRVFSVTITED